MQNKGVKNITWGSKEFSVFFVFIIIQPDNQGRCGAKILIMFLQAKKMSNSWPSSIWWQLISCNDKLVPPGSRSFQNVGDEEVGNHFEPYKKCDQVMEFSFNIK